MSDKNPSTLQVFDNDPSDIPAMKNFIAFLFFSHFPNKEIALKSINDIKKEAGPSHHKFMSQVETWLKNYPEN